MAERTQRKLELLFPRLLVTRFDWRQRLKVLFGMKVWTLMGEDGHLESWVSRDAPYEIDMAQYEKCRASREATVPRLEAAQPQKETT